MNRIEVISIGLKARTARAIAVMLGGDHRTPVAVGRVEMVFATSQTPTTFQPFHDVLDLPWDRAQIKAGAAESTLVTTATEKLAQLVKELRDDGGRVLSAGIVGAPERDLAAIASPHIRAHAAEGVLFRRILEQAAAKNGLEWFAFPERGLEDLALHELKLTAEEFKEHMARLGREAGRPWRADEKAAATGAWLALRSASSA